MKALILYSSRDGQTQAIASNIAKTLEGQIPCDVVDLAQAATIKLVDYQRVVIGASIRYGRFSPLLDAFISRNLPVLQTIPSAFFAVNLTARKPEKRSPETNAYTRKFLLKTPWKPDLCQVFAGALRYPRYGWLDRTMIKLIMRMTGGETDTSKEVEYTDWSSVSEFAGHFAHLALKK